MIKGRQIRAMMMGKQITAAGVGGFRGMCLRIGDMPTTSSVPKTSPSVR